MLPGTVSAPEYYKFAEHVGKPRGRAYMEADSRLINNNGFPAWLGIVGDPLSRQYLPLA